MSKYSPGPWTYHEGFNTIVGHDGHDILCVGCNRCSRTEADVRLMAAAPELLAILKTIVAAEYTFDHEAHAVAESLIARIEEEGECSDTDAR